MFRTLVAMLTSLYALTLCLMLAGIVMMGTGGETSAPSAGSGVGLALFLILHG